MKNLILAIALLCAVSTGIEAFDFGGSREQAGALALNQAISDYNKARTTVETAIDAADKAAAEAKDTAHKSQAAAHKAAKSQTAEDIEAADKAAAAAKDAADKVAASLAELAELQAKADQLWQEYQNLLPKSTSWSLA